MVAILSDQKDVIFEAVRTMYTQVAFHPTQGFHFPTGRSGCTFVGYPGEQLDALPETAVESFAGVGYPFAGNGIDPGDSVLDIGSGSGTDLLIASALVGPAGRVIGLDFTDAMLEKLESNAALAGATNVQILKGNAEEIPLPNDAVNVVTSNGVLNLVPDKRRAVAEIFRVLRPGGRVQIADIVLGTPLSEECRSNPQLWAECVVGATLEEDYLDLFRSAGFAQVEVLGRFDYFSGSSSPETRSIAASFNAQSIVLRAVKPPAGEMRDPSPWPRGSAASPAASPESQDASAAGATLQADKVLEVYGQSCGALEPILKSEMRSLESGQVLEVLSDAPAARLGIPSWSRLTGHALLTTVEEDSQRTRFFLRKK
jgi:arsenite methyltransferase